MKLGDERVSTLDGKMSQLWRASLKAARDETAEPFRDGLLRQLAGDGVTLAALAVESGLDLAAVDHVVNRAPIVVWSGGGLASLYDPRVINAIGEAIHRALENVT